MKLLISSRTECAPFRNKVRALPEQVVRLEPQRQRLRGTGEKLRGVYEQESQSFRHRPARRDDPQPDSSMPHPEEELRPPMPLVQFVHRLCSRVSSSTGSTGAISEALTLLPAAVRWIDCLPKAAVSIRMFRRCHAVAEREANCELFAARGTTASFPKRVDPKSSQCRSGPSAHCVRGRTLLAYRYSSIAYDGISSTL